MVNLPFHHIKFVNFNLSSYKLSKFYPFIIKCCLILPFHHKRLVNFTLLFSSYILFLYEKLCLYFCTDLFMFILGHSVSLLISSLVEYTLPVTFPFWQFSYGGGGGALDSKSSKSVGKKFQERERACDNWI